MRNTRIFRPVALYDSSIAAQTFEAAGHVILNPNDFDEVIFSKYGESVSGS